MSYFGRPDPQNPKINQSRIIFKQPGSACNNYEGNLFRYRHGVKYYVQVIVMFSQNADRLMLMVRLLD